MSTSVEVPVPRLLSVSILHRHGARGPGASEVAPFSELTDVCSQWNESEFEVLTTVGHTMITTLGTWFAKKYSSKFATPKVMFRCSKSGRAMESGLDFVRAFNMAISREHTSVSEKPTPLAFASEKYQIDEDYFFRPWKIQKDLTEQSKKRAKNDPEFVGIATNNEAFLIEIFSLAGAKEEYLKNSYKALWSSTHLFALLECEHFWHKPLERNALSKRIPAALISKIEELACHVWDRRFLHSGCDMVMGAPLTLELFQQLFNVRYNMSIYSAHDYSILSVLGSLGIIPHLERATSFGSYLMFELWDGQPPRHSSTAHNTSTSSNPSRNDQCNADMTTDIDNALVKEECILTRKRSRQNLLSEDREHENRILRILANFSPFPLGTGGGGDGPSSSVGDLMEEGREVVLAEFSIEEVREKLQCLYESLTSKDMYSPALIAM